MTLTPPSKFYHGPITGIEACYGFPYSADPHCASCGSTKVSKPTYKDGMKSFRCNRCKKKTTLARSAAPDRDARYEIRKEGYSEVECLTREELDDALWDVLMNLDAHYFSEKAREYYGDYYDGLLDNEERYGDGSYQEEADDLEADVPWVNKLMALTDGYVDGLEVGESYNLPDFPVTVARIGDRATPRATTSKSVKKAPARKPAGKASARRR